MNTVMEIVDYLTKAKITKNNNIIVIGGGLTQDIGGFVSTIFKRGINWILIPTTLLCMTDSSIGSKICLNTESKNLENLQNLKFELLEEKINDGEEDFNEGRTGVGLVKE